MVKDLQNDCVKVNNIHPSDLTNAYNLLINYRACHSIKQVVQLTSSIFWSSFLAYFWTSRRSFFMCSLDHCSIKKLESVLHMSVFQIFHFFVCCFNWYLFIYCLHLIIIIYHAHWYICGLRVPQNCVTKTDFFWGCTAYIYVSYLTLYVYLYLV